MSRQAVVATPDPGRDGGSRIALGIEYDGSRYCGWQFQTHGPSVQQAVQEALSRVAAAPVHVHCAGRTDSGVHAWGQVVHFDSTVKRPERAWLLGTNCHLPADIAVQWAQPVGADFHARFSAVARHYRYLILRRPARSALWDRRALWTHRPLAVAPMRAAAQALIGRHDFSSFRALACQARSPVRTLHYLDVHEHGALIEIAVGADGFLHHMVRNLAGVLMAIGRGEAPVTWAADLLARRDRAQGGVTAPAHGLYLSRVDYPVHYRLPHADDQRPVMF